MPVWDDGPPPTLPDTRAQVVDPRHAYQMVSMLEGVVERGTARAARAIGKPLAGKTGTTNESKDTWFVGFSPDLVIGVFVGYDQPRGLGEKETGATVALPIWVEVMGEALKDQPGVALPYPARAEHRARRRRDRTPADRDEPDGHRRGVPARH